MVQRPQIHGLLDQHLNCCNSVNNWGITFKFETAFPWNIAAAINMRKRWKIVNFHNNGRSSTDIARELRICRKSVGRILRIHQATNDIIPGKSTGHRHKTTARNDEVYTLWLVGNALNQQRQ